jgi:hypothetical protein
MDEMRVAVTINRGARREISPDHPDDAAIVKLVTVEVTWK